MDMGGPCLGAGEGRRQDKNQQPSSAKQDVAEDREGLALGPKEREAYHSVVWESLWFEQPPSLTLGDLSQLGSVK